MAQNNQISEVMALNLSIDALFGGATKSALLSDGREVTFELAKVKHIAILVSCVQAMLGGLGQEESQELIQATAEARRFAAESGETAVINEVMTRIAVQRLDGILAAVVEAIEPLSKAVTVLTSLTEEDVEDLSIAELANVMIGIFAVNFSFFSQSFPAIMRASFVQQQSAAMKDKLGSRKAASSANAGKKSKQHKAG